MSSKGGQSLDKHGGAHTASHGTTVLINNSVVPTKIDGRTTYIGVQNIGEEVNVIQDGGQLANFVQSEHVLSAEVLATSGKDHEITTVDLNGIETAMTLSGHTIANAEWLKTNLGSLGGVFLIQNGAVAADSVTVSEEDLGKYEVKEVGELAFNTDVAVDSQPQVNLQEFSGTSLQGARSILVAHNPVTPAVNTPRTQQGHVVNLSNSLLQGGQHLSLPTCRLGDIGGKEGFVLSESYQQTLEEIEHGSQLNIGEDEMLEDSRKEYQAMEFQSLSSDKSNTLMTPQELELMPEAGKEFEESVGPKEDLRPITPTIEKHLVTSRKAIQHTGTAVSTLKTPISHANTVVLTAIPTIPFSNSNMTSAANSAHTVYITNNSSPAVLSQSGIAIEEVTQRQIPVTDGTTENSGAATTLSISSDTTSNSTQILINTPQGQQIFHINTADLNRATTALQPLALQGGVVGKDVNGKIVNAEMINGITVEDGYLVIPVNGDDIDPSMVDVHDLSLTDGEMSDDSIGEDSTPAVPGRLWMCSQEGCHKTFSKLSKLKIHLMRHTGERPFKCSIQDCDWAFTTAYKLKRHEESHAKKKDFECDYPGCGRKFTTIYNLNTHRKLHERPCTEECPDCGLRFPTMRKLDLHMKNHIGAQKNYKCPIEGCNKMFFSPHCMGSHTRVHQENRDLTCHFEGCGKVYDKLCRLKQHMRTHTGEKPYVCVVESCGWAFSTASKLKRHQRKHTGERKWVCPVEDCSKAFMRAEHLKGHLVTHSGERPFICQVEGCGARFTAKSSMYVHIKKHNETDKKVLYFCPLDGCDKKFNNKTGLRAHIAKHYQNALAQANAGDLSSIIPILSPEDIQEGLEGLMAAQEGLPAGAAQDAIVASVNSILPPESVTVDQTDLIVIEDGTMATDSVGPQVSDLCSTAGVSGAMVTQLVVSADELGAVSAVSPTDLNESAISEPVAIEHADPRLVSPAATSESTTILFSADLESSLLQVEKSSGSARTDYRSNHMLVDRAKKRRRLLKNTLEGGDSNSSSIDLNNFQELGEGKSSFSVDSPLVAQTAADPFPGGELVTSAAITFRDPETGAIYVQTQLLQDDPPNPDMYSDDTSMDGSTQSVMTSPDLPTILFQDAHTDDEFTGTTINLQDLA